VPVPGSTTTLLGGAATVLLGGTTTVVRAAGGGGLLLLTQPAISDPKINRVEMYFIVVSSKRPMGVLIRRSV